MIWQNVLDALRVKLQDTNSDYWPDAELLGYANATVRRIAIDARWQRTTLAQPAPSGAAVITLDPTVVELINVHWLNVPLRKYSTRDADAKLGSGWRSLVSTPLAYLRDTTGEGAIRLYPAPPAITIVAPAAPGTPVLSAGLLSLTGATWKYTYVDGTNGIESAPSSASSAANPAFQRAAIPVTASANAAVTAIYLYRSAGSGLPYFFVLAGANATASLSDNVQTAGVAMAATAQYLTPLSLDAVTMPADMVLAADTVYLPIDGFNAMIYGVLYLAYEKEQDRQDLQLSLDYHNRMMGELKRLMAKSAREFDPVPLSGTIPSFM